MTSRIQSIVSAIAVIAVEFAAMIGLSLDTDTVIDVISAVVFIAGLLYGLWKNHNITNAAIEGQRLVNALKSNIDLPSGIDENGNAYIEWKIPISYEDVE